MKLHVDLLPAPYKAQQQASTPQEASLTLLPLTLLPVLVASSAPLSPSNPTSVPAGWTAPHQPLTPHVNEC